MKIFIEWKGHRWGPDIRSVKKIKLDNEVLIIETKKYRSKILLEDIKGFETF